MTLRCHCRDCWFQTKRDTLFIGRNKGDNSLFFWPCYSNIFNQISNIIELLFMTLISYISDLTLFFVQCPGADHAWEAGLMLLGLGAAHLFEVSGPQDSGYWGGSCSPTSTGKFYSFRKTIDAQTPSIQMNFHCLSCLVMAWEARKGLCQEIEAEVLH